MRSRFGAPLNLDGEWKAGNRRKLIQYFSLSGCTSASLVGHSFTRHTQILIQAQNLCSSPSRHCSASLVALHSKEKTRNSTTIMGKRRNTAKTGDKALYKGRDDLGGRIKKNDDDDDNMYDKVDRFHNERDQEVIRLGEEQDDDSEEEDLAGNKEAVLDLGVGGSSSSEEDDSDDEGDDDDSLMDTARAKKSRKDDSDSSGSSSSSDSDSDGGSDSDSDDEEIKDLRE